MLTFSHPEDLCISLTECYNYLARGLSRIIGYSIKTRTYSKKETPERDSIELEDGSLQVRLAWPHGKIGCTVVILPKTACDDPFCKKALGAFVATSHYIAKRSKGSWDLKALLIREEQYLWDNLILSMRFSGNQKYNVLDVLNTLRDSLLFKYEGASTPLGVLITWNWYQLRPQLVAESCLILPFRPSFDLASGLRGDKALHLLSNGATSLLVVSPSGKVSSWISFSASRPVLPNENWELVPQKYWHLHKVLRGRDVIISTTDQNELMLFNSQFVMKCIQGKWYRVSAPPLSKLLRAILPEDGAVAVANLVRKLSNDRTGALICIAHDTSALIANASPGLQKRFRKAKLFKVEQIDLEVLSRVAGIDGALILDNQGYLVNAGVILSLPVGTTAPGQGARSAAALFASRYGIAIKVSHDGPVSVYDDGKEIRCAA